LAATDRPAPALVELTKNWAPANPVTFSLDSLNRHILAAGHMLEIDTPSNSR
jgi:hypothetical protein